MVEEVQADQPADTLHAAFQRAVDAMIVSNDDGVFVDANPAACELIGVERSTLQGRSLWEFTLRDQEQEPLREAILGDGRTEGKTRLRSVEGAIREVEYSVSRNILAGQHLTVLSDVTEEMGQEPDLKLVTAVSNSLRKARTRQEVLSAALRHIPTLLPIDGVAIAVPEQDSDAIRLERAAGVWADIEGATIADGQGLTKRVLTSAQEVTTNELRREDEPLLLTPKMRRQKFAAACLPLQSEEDVPGALWVSRPQPFSHSEMASVRAVAQMIGTALQSSTFYEQLADQTVLMQRIMDTVDNGLVLLDGEQRVVFLNRAARRHLSLLNESSRVGSKLEQLAGEAVANVLEESREQPAVSRVTVNKGRKAEFEVAAYAVDGASGPEGWVLVLYDMTEAQREMEHAQQQQRLAVVGQLAAGVAHDFNNIISSVLLYLELIQAQAELTDRNKEWLDTVFQQIDRATELVRQVLDFSRRSVMERTLIDLVPFCQALQQVWQRDFPETIEINLHFEADQYIINGDLARLRQALMNLALNARDAMPEGGRLELSLSHVELTPGERPPIPELTPGLWLQLTLSDNGTGISEDALPHIFEPFFTTKTPADGSGLGLAQAYGIVRQHGGHLAAESRPQQGTTLHVYLPLEREPEGSHCKMNDVSGQGEGQMKTILVVEDEESVREALTDTLTALGYDVVSAANGQEAVDLIRGEVEIEVDLVISDLMMPQIDGVGLHELLQAERPDLNMIIITGYPLADKGQALLEHGIVDWIQKPFSARELNDKVQLALE